MRYKTLLVTLLAAASVLFLSGCPTEADPAGETKTTHIDSIALTRSLALGDNLSWWETDIDTELPLSGLLPEGGIKSDTEYTITVSGQSDVNMEQFQFVFSSSGWNDLTTAPSGYFQIKSNEVFSFTETLTTKSDLSMENIATGALGFSNQITITVDDLGKTKAILTDVTITINDGTDEKTTVKNIIELKGNYSEAPISWWESDINASNLKLSNLLPGGEVKNNAAYEVIISGKSNTDMEKFQFVFSSPSGGWEWADLSTYTEVLPISKDSPFSYTRTLTTVGNAVDYITKGALGLSNQITVTETPSKESLGKAEATLTDVTITITEK